VGAVVATWATVVGWASRASVVAGPLVDDFGIDVVDLELVDVFGVDVELVDGAGIDDATVVTGDAVVPKSGGGEESRSAT
jgi:hypothetical protein